MTEQHTPTHTPGPWHVNSTNIEALVDPENSPSYWAPVCFVEDEWAPEIVQANARLIANAPAMLACLVEAQEALDVLADDAEEAGYPVRATAAADLAMRLREAINKATGKE